MLGLVAGSTPAAADALRLEPAEATRNDPVRHYDIAPGPLGDTLNRVARRAGVVFTFEPSLVSGKRSTGVRGDLSVRDAFSAALQGSGLEIRVDETERLHAAQGSGATVARAGRRYVVGPPAQGDQVRAKRFRIGPLPGLGLTKEGFRAMCRVSLRKTFATPTR